MRETQQPEPVLIKRYGGTRLYDGAAGRYRTVDELRGWLAERMPFAVYDADTGEDITLILLS